MSFLFGVRSYSYIGKTLDTYMAILAAVFCADTYEQEVESNRWEVLHLVKRKKKFHTINQRLAIQFTYLSILFASCLFIYYIKDPSMLIDGNVIRLSIEAIFACSTSIIFFGTLTYTLINVLQNQWAGIGCVLVLWVISITTIGMKIPKYINIFWYVFKDIKQVDDSYQWVVGKMVALLISMVLIYVNRYLLHWGKGLR